jgi:hypothetical protein
MYMDGGELSAKMGGSPQYTQKLIICDFSDLRSKSPAIRAGFLKSKMLFILH